MGRNVEDANTYRIGHPLAQQVLHQGKALPVEPQTVTFEYSGSGKQIAVLTHLVGECGWLSCCSLSLSALEVEDHLVFAGVTEGGKVLDEVQCRRLFDLPGTEAGRATPATLVETLLQERVAQRRGELLEEMETKNSHWFDVEMDKLERWAEDRRSALKAELDELDLTIKETKKAARLAPNLPTKLERRATCANSRQSVMRPGVPMTRPAVR